MSQENSQLRIYSTDANSQCYLETPIRLQDSVRRKRPKLWTNKWIIYHDNVPRYHELCERLYDKKHDYPIKSSWLDHEMLLKEEELNTTTRKVTMRPQ